MEFNIRFERILIYLYISLGILSYILAYSLLSIGRGVSALSYNSWFLWKRFRETAGSLTIEWLWDPTVMEGLDKYTRGIKTDFNQFNAIYFKIPKHRRHYWLNFFDKFADVTRAFFVDFMEYMSKGQVEKLTFFTKEKKIEYRFLRYLFVDFYVGLPKEESKVFKDILHEATAYDLESVRSFDFSALF